MCGIAGYIGTRRIGDEAVTRCLELMGRRGPDGCGHYRHAVGDRHVLLVHTRLAIIDLDPRANQPFVRQGMSLCFNGEVYNYRELRQGLEREGEIFTTTSDTEVLHRILSRRGQDGLDACEGMWAFASYKESDGSLLLCRDRFGEKPLCLHQASDGLYFASTPKALFALLGHQLPINETQLRRFLVYGYKFLYKSGETFFQGLRDLSPGHVLRVDGRSLMRDESYWRFNTAEQDADMSFEEAAELVREKLLRSLELRLRSDVPLAFCMSGGVDSNSLISAAKRVFGYDVHGFTIVNQDERYDEQELVEAAVKDLGVRHTALPLSTQDFLPNLRALVLAHDAPVYTISYYVHWMLMRHIREAGYKISLSGTAADELFTGYYDHHLFYLAAIVDDAEHHAASRAKWLKYVKPMVRNTYLQDPDCFVRDPDFRDHILLGADRFSKRLNKPYAEAFHEVDYPGSVLRKRLLNELFYEVIPVILHEDDANAMDYSIENRSPFLDRQLFEASLTIPVRHLVDDGMAKAVLRKAMRGIAPDVILDCRRKVGFNAPLLDLLDVGAPDVRQCLLGDSPVYSIVRKDWVEGLLDQERLPNSESKFLFSFLGVKMFVEEYA